jgi:hypothetical protein
VPNTTVKPALKSLQQPSVPRSLPSQQKRTYASVAAGVALSLFGAFLRTSCTPVDRFSNPSLTAGFVTQVEGAGLLVNQAHRQALTRLATTITNHPEVANSSNVVQAILWSQTTGFAELAALQPSAPVLEEIGLSMGLLREPKRDLSRAFWLYLNGRLAKRDQTRMNDTQLVYVGAISQQALALAEANGTPITSGSPIDLQALVVAFTSGNPPAAATNSSDDANQAQALCLAKSELAIVLKRALAVDVAQCK